MISFLLNEVGQSCHAALEDDSKFRFLDVKSFFHLKQHSWCINTMENCMSEAMASPGYPCKQEQPKPVQNVQTLSGSSEKFP